MGLGTIIAGVFGGRQTAPLGGGITYTPATVTGSAAAGASAGSLASTLTGSVSYSVLSGALAVNASTGALTTTGTAPSSGSISARVIADNGSQIVGAAISVPVQAVAATLALAGTLGSATVGQAYSFTPTTSGGTSPYTYALTGTLPAGLSFSASTGAITGTPTAAGTASGLNITVTDSASRTASLGAFSLAVSAAAGAVPANTTAPIIYGTPQVSEPLIAGRGVWSNTPSSFTFLWNGAGSLTNQASYTPVAADVGATLTCTVTATNSAGTSAAVTATAAAAVIAAPTSIALASYRTDVTAATPLADGGLSQFAYTGSPSGTKLVTVDRTTTFQTYQGMGAFFGESTAYNLMTLMTPAQRQAHLTDLFTTKFNRVRIPVGAKCTDAIVGSTFRTCNDVANDTSMSNFSITDDMAYVIPVLQQVLTINPNLFIIATPWSYPAWMKTGSPQTLTSGQFNATAINMQAAALYMVKFVQAYAALGVPIGAVTPQNEPNNGGTNYPCTGWSASDLNTYIKSYLGPAFQSAGLTTQIWPGDASYGDSGNYVYTPHLDTATLPFVGAWCYHGYDGTPAQITNDLGSSPALPVHLTENARGPATSSNIESHLRLTGSDVLAYGLQKGLSSITWWVHALTTGGGPLINYNNVEPLIQIDPSGNVIAKPCYIALQHICRFVQPGAVRVAATNFASGSSGTDVESLAFLNPDGSMVVYMINMAATGGSTTVSVVDPYIGNLSTTFTLNGGDLLTMRYKAPAAVGKALAPAIATAGAVNAVTISLAGAAPPNGGAAITGYDIWDSTTAGAEIKIASNVALPYNVTGLTAGTTYYFQAAAVNSQGSSDLGAEASGVPTASTLLYSQTISGTAGQSINTVTPSTGSGTWAGITGFIGGSVLIDTATTGVYFNQSNCWWYNNFAPGTANYYVETTYIKKTAVSTDSATVMARQQGSGAQTAYSFRWSESAQAFQLVRYNSGTGTSLGSSVTTLPGASSAFTWAVGASHALRISVVGAVITGYVDGQQVIQVTDTSPITPAGNMGFRQVGQNGTATTCLHLASITAGTA